MDVLSLSTFVLLWVYNECMQIIKQLKNFLCSGILANKSHCSAIMKQLRYVILLFQNPSICTEIINLLLAWFAWNDCDSKTGKHSLSDCQKKRHMAISKTHRKIIPKAASTIGTFCNVCRRKGTACPKFWFYVVRVYRVWNLILASVFVSSLKFCQFIFPR